MDYMNQLGRWGLSVALCLGIAACGGGGSSAPASPSVDEINEVSYDGIVLPAVEGEFLNTAETGFVYPSDPLGQWDIRDCRNTQGYFESARTRVFYSTGSSQVNALKMATWVEHAIDLVTAYFDSDLAGFMGNRDFSVSTYLLGAEFLEQNYAYDSDGTVYLPSVPGISFDFDPAIELDREHRMLAFYKALLAMPVEQVTSIAAEMREQGYPSYIGERSQDKVMVCFSSALNDTYWGTGSTLGFTAHTLALLERDAPVVAHELVHTYHLNRTLDGYIRPMDQWFTEGIAEYASGLLEISMSDHNQSTPLRDKMGVEANHTKYQHYAIAIAYLEQSSPGFASNVLEYLREQGVSRFWGVENQSIGFPQYLPYELGEEANPEFVEAFNLYAKRPNGSPLTYSEFEAEYHDIIDEWLAENPQAEATSRATATALPDLLR